MFKLDPKTELNQISLTGIRAIVMMGLLIIAPRSIEEIRKYFIEYKIMDETQSNDILRIDLNTIKSVGCKISRAVSSNGYKYVLTKHPFMLHIEEHEIKNLKRIYNKIKKQASITQLIELDVLFKKIANNIYDDNIKESFLGVSVLKYFDVELIKDLLLDCKNNRTLEVLYKNPISNKDRPRKIIAHDLVYENNKIYLHGYNPDLDKNIALNILRIKKILSRYFHKNDFVPKTITVKFILKNLSSEVIKNNEEILEINNNEMLVEGFYNNDFLAVQRILSFGANAIVLEPYEIKNTVIKKIKEMRDLYGD